MVRFQEREGEAATQEEAAEAKRKPAEAAAEEEAVANKKKKTEMDAAEAAAAEKARAAEAAASVRGCEVPEGVLLRALPRPPDVCCV